MIRFLVRLVSSGAGAGRPACEANVRQFTPQLESLDGRTLPSVSPVAGVAAGIDLSVAALQSDEAHAPNHVSSYGGVSGGVLRNDGPVSAYGGVSGGVLRNDGPVSTLGGVSGGVLRSDDAAALVWVGDYGSAAGEVVGSGGGEITTYITRSSGEEIPQTL